jgi:hypothetical protein
MRLRDGAVRIIDTIAETKQLTEEMDLGNIAWWNKKTLDYYTQVRGNTPEGQLAARYVSMIAAIREEMQTAINSGYAPSRSSWEQALKQLDEAVGKESVLTQLDVVNRLMNYTTGAMGRGGVMIPGGGTSRYAPPQQAPASTPPATTAPPSDAPQVGKVFDGYRFKGGDPNAESSWEKVQ